MADIGEETEVLCLAAAAIILQRAQRRRSCKKRGVWVRPWLRRRSNFGAFHTLLQELRAEDNTEFLKFLRMEPRHFHNILDLTLPLIQRQDTVMRTAIPAAERLAVTLRFLASGRY